MEDAWWIKCGSVWPPPASAPQALPSPVPLLSPPPPPQIVAASQVLPPASANQMNIYSHQRFHPFVSHEANVEDHAFVQESMGFSNLNNGSCKTSKTEMSNSFLALLSGPSHPLTCEFQPLSKSGSNLSTSKFPSCDIGNVPSSVDCSVSVPYSSVLPINLGSNTISNGSERSSYSMLKMPSISACGNPAVLCNDFQALSALFPSSNTGKMVTSHAHQGSERGLAASAMNNTNTIQPQNPNIWPHPIRQVDGSINISSHASSFVRGCPRVFCMGKVGELFVSDNGLLGVFCLCHSLRMSVAKFCEHSGLHTVNPGDAVHLENGETVAQWRRLFFLNIGVRVPDDGSGWDWPDGSFMSSSLGKPKVNNLLKNNNFEAFQLQELLSEKERFEGQEIPKGHTSYFPHMGTIALDKLLSRFQDNTENRNSHEGVHIDSTCITSPVPFNEHMLKAGKENHPFVNPSMLNSIFVRPQNSGSKLIANNISVPGKAGNFSTLFPSSGPVKSFVSDFSAKGTSISTNVPLMDKDSTSSSIELRLGQPPQHNHDFIMSGTAAMHQQQFPAQFGPQKQPVHHPISQGSVMSRAPEKCMQTLYQTPSQVSTLNTTLSSMDAIQDPGQEVVDADVDKNSLISCFLSHFSTSERKTRSQVVENTTNRSENIGPGLVNCDSLPAKCIIDFSRNISNGVEAKSNVNTPEISNKTEKGKGARVALEDEFCTGKPFTFLQNKRTGDLKVFSESSNEHSCQNTSFLDRQNLTCFHQSFSRLLEEPDTRHANEFGQASFLASTNIHDNAFLRYVSARAASPASTFFATNPICFSGPASSVQNKMDIDITQHLVDESTRFPALKHVLKLSKMAHSPPSLEMSDQQRQLYCPSTMGMLRKASKGDMMACEKLRCERHCSTVQEVSSVAFRPPHSCCNSCSCDVAENLSAKTCTTGTKRMCNLTGCTQNASLFSNEKHIKSPSCHACKDNQSFLRLFRTDNKITEELEDEMSAQKEGNGYVPAKCSCGAHLKCLRGCRLCRQEVPTDSISLKEHVCGKSHTLSPAYNIDHLSQDGKRIALGQFDGSRHFVVNDDCRSSFGRDIPTKELGNSDKTTVQKTADIVAISSSMGNQLTANTMEDFNIAHEEADSTKDQRMPSVYSACSAPVITEMSVEENNLDSSIGGIGATRSLSDPAVDEGSLAEKCGSSDDVIDNTRWDESMTIKSKVDYQKVSDYASSHKSRNEVDKTNHQSGKFINEDKLGMSFVPRKKRNQFHAECNVKKSTMHREPIKNGRRAERKKKATKWRRLGSSFTPSCHSVINQDSSCNGHSEIQCSSEGLKLHGCPQNMTHKLCTSSNKSLGAKRKHNAFSSTESLPFRISDGHHTVSKKDVQMQSVNCDSSNRTSKSSAGTKFKKSITTNEKKESKEQENNPELSGKLLKYIPDSKKARLTGGVSPQERMVKPVVRGNSGVISFGNLPGKSKPVKIVSLNTVLKLAKRCNISESEEEPRQICDLGMDNAGCLGSKGETCERFVTERVRDTGTGNLMSNFNDQVKPRCKETRKRRLSELTGKDTKITLCSQTFGESQHSELLQPGYHLKKFPRRGIKEDLVGSKPKNKKGRKKPISRCSQQPHSRSGRHPQEGQDNMVDFCHANARKISNKGCKHQQSLLDSDAFCCVCGSSNRDDGNHLLECNNCLIRVHQACYGVPKVPKGHWSCRPCRINSKNIACVLCGYDGGAMTRAVRSQHTVKSLLKVWKEGISYMPTKPAPSPATDSLETLNQSSKVHNSITAGALDPTITQWIHVVCGLWTPGTRCPNVDTMSAFDVSGVLSATRRMVCSMCKRPGGSCIQCRIVDCSTHFHPWCAHQKGLLQSEVEGVDNENVGFYGRCLLHATRHNYHSDGIPMDAGTESPRKKEFSCARTEGNKGRKRDHGIIHPLRGQNDNGRCIVPQEQLNAWLHINGQKSCTRVLLKSPASEIDYDCRKEYARFKQVKGWKHLVVYKSRIHGLGLYTSQFIPRGAMVVEYVGEIVGLRVADKREIEYQSGKKLQYKSACYFFRIDKEHIIDATRKGGIARFVNHSCLPNCVAKVISVRNEKKVVFFAERDINPGEEITYDYHFNHEEEGKKIPCFCNSKNCRRYLN